MTTPTLDDIHRMISYNPLTGEFTWKVYRTFRAVIGGIAGTAHHTGYTRIRILGKQFLAHRLAWLMQYGELPENEIDHIDQDKSNNRIANLRSVSRSQNEANKPGREWNQLRKKGVKVAPSGRARAVITVHRKTIPLGTFDTIDEAAHAYNKAALQHFGDCAVLNPIGTDYEIAAIAAKAAS